MYVLVCKGGMLKDFVIAFQFRFITFVRFIRMHLMLRI